MFETTLTSAQIEKFTSASYWRARTITDFLDEAAAAAPDKPAFIDSRTQVTYG